jgi:hypothetical protein
VNSHVTGNSRGGYNAQHKIEEIHRKKITKTSDSNGFPAYTTRLRDLLVNTKNWYRRECDLWAQLGKKISSSGGGFLQKIRQRCLLLAVLLPFGKGTICADFAGSHGDVARAEGTK